MTSATIDGFSKVTTPPVRRTCYGVGSGCCDTVLDTLLSEAFHPRQHVVLLCLTVEETTTYRNLGDELVEMPRNPNALDLDLITFGGGPSPSERRDLSHGSGSDTV